MQEKPNSLMEHLVNLLFEEFKQRIFFDDLEKFGLAFSKVVVIKNWDIVVDIVGFPRDSTPEYDFDFINSGGEARDKRKKIPDERMFCRDWLFDNYFDSVNEIGKGQKIFINEKGLSIEEYIQEEKIKYRLLEHIKWLYQQYDNYVGGKLDFNVK